MPTCPNVQHAGPGLQVSLQELQADCVHVGRTDGLTLTDCQGVVLGPQGDRQGQAVLVGVAMQAGQAGYGISGVGLSTYCMELMSTSPGIRVASSQGCFRAVGWQGMQNALPIHSLCKAFSM